MMAARSDVEPCTLNVHAAAAERGFQEARGGRGRAARGILIRPALIIVGNAGRPTLARPFRRRLYVTKVTARLPCVRTPLIFAADAPLIGGFTTAVNVAGASFPRNKIRAATPPQRRLAEECRNKALGPNARPLGL
ncbi:unnamed protein product, partial [Iphiclides podalirius]